MLGAIRVGPGGKGLRLGADVAVVPVWLPEEFRVRADVTPLAIKAKEDLHGGN